MKRQSLILFLLCATATVVAQEGFSTFTAAWWNVENFFDTHDDPTTADEEFTPQGDRHWTRRRFEAKRDAIYKALVRAELPMVVGLAEVENARVLDELCNGTPLRKAGYQFVHYDSPDRRGIDCALLYRRDYFRVLESRPIVVSDTAQGFRTRDILLVEGVSAVGDSVILLLNHWPSRRGGITADRRRRAIAETLRTLITDLHRAHPAAAVLAMGDMNASSSDPAISLGLGFENQATNAEGLQNLTILLPRDKGSYRYQGQWEYLDAMFLMGDSSWRVADFALMYDEHLLVEEKNNLGYRPYRTYRGPIYEGGPSDHLPLLLTLTHAQPHN